MPYLRRYGIGRRHLPTAIVSPSSWFYFITTGFLYASRISVHHKAQSKNSVNRHSQRPRTSVTLDAIRASLAHPRRDARTQTNASQTEDDISLRVLTQFVDSLTCLSVDIEVDSSTSHNDSSKMDYEVGADPIYTHTSIANSREDEGRDITESKITNL